MSLIKFEFLIVVSTTLVFSNLGLRQRTFSSGSRSEYASQVGYGGFIQGVPTCKSPPVEIPTDWISVSRDCSFRMLTHSAHELQVALSYLAMGAFFSRDCVNRAGYAAACFERAGSKRQNALKLVAYLSMRGNTTDHVGEMIQEDAPYQMVWDSLAMATEYAIRMETGLTDSIRRVIADCEESEGFNDFHASDWVVQELLDDQYATKRRLVDLLTELRRMEGHGKMGEILVDWNLQRGLTQVMG